MLLIKIILWLFDVIVWFFKDFLNPMVWIEDVIMGVFVGLPTLLCAIYFFAIATPMYATKTEFVIQKSEAAAYFLQCLFRDHLLSRVELERFEEVISFFDRQGTDLRKGKLEVFGNLKLRFQI